jgi:hypothetical protein
MDEEANGPRSAMVSGEKGEVSPADGGPRRHLRRQEPMNSGVETSRNIIDGSWEEAPERMPATNPAPGEQIASLPKSDRARAGRAMAAAKRAKAAWAR